VIVGPLDRNWSTENKKYTKCKNSFDGKRKWPKPLQLAIFGAENEFQFSTKKAEKSDTQSGL